MVTFYLSADVARIAGIGPAGVREAIVRGEAVPIGRSPSGVAIFDEAAVERYLAARRLRFKRPVSEPAQAV